MRLANQIKNLGKASRPVTNQRFGQGFNKLVVPEQIQTLKQTVTI